MRRLAPLLLLAAVACGGGGDKTDHSGHGSGTRSTEKPSRDVEVTALDLRFEGLNGFTAKAGETVRFPVRNNGNVTHEFDVLDPDAGSIGGSGHIASKTSGEAVLTFKKAGTYTYLCRIDGHDRAGMKGTFTVT